MKDFQKKQEVPEGENLEEFLSFEDKLEPDDGKEEKIQVKPIALPKGGGAFPGLEPDFQMDEQKGSAALHIPIWSPSVREQKEEVGLLYESSAGNGVFGRGFQLNIPYIVRKTEFGVPVYDDDKDIFEASEYGALVFAGKERAEGTRLYYPETEKEFPRIRMLRSGQDSWWEITKRDGVCYTFGRKDGSTARDPEHPGRVFMWRLSEAEDEKGNRILYEYEEDGVLRNIRYGNYRKPGEEESYAYEILFSYDEGRCDSFLNCRSGFLRETKKRCNKISVFCNIPKRCEILSYHFHYCERDGISLLDRITAAGADGAALPSLAFSYTGASLQEGRFRLLEAGGYPLPGPFNEKEYHFVDLFGDGMAGILYNDDKAAMYYAPCGGGKYEKPRILSDFPMEGGGGKPYYYLTSLYGDGRYDMVVSLPQRKGFYGHKDGGFLPFVPFKKAPNLMGNGSEIDFADMQGDSLSHLYVPGKEQARYYPSLKEEGFGDAVTTPAPPGFFGIPTEKKCRVVRFLDFFGDGLSHRVLIENGRVLCYPNLGYGNFGKVIEVSNPPVIEDAFDGERLFFADLDGSGTMDLIYLYSDYAEIFFNRGGKRFSDGVKVYLPEAYTKKDYIQFADIYGLGCQTMIFTKMGMKPRHYSFDCFDGKKPYLLEKMENNRGLTASIVYQSSASFYFADKKKGIAWKSNIPFPAQAVREIRTADAVTGRASATAFWYRDPYYDKERRKFCGFGFVDTVKTEAYEDERIKTPVIHKRCWYHTGSRRTDNAADYFRPEEASLSSDSFPPEGASAGVRRSLAGLLRREELFDGENDGQGERLLEAKSYFWQVEKKAANVYFPHLKERVALTYDGLPEDAKTEHLGILKTDAFGNVLREAKVYYRRKNPAAKGQERTLIKVTDRRFVNLAAGVWRLGVQVEKKEYAIYGEENFLPFALLERKVEEALRQNGGEDKLLAWEKNYFWDAGGKKELPFGEAEKRALLHHREEAVYPVDKLRALYHDGFSGDSWEKDSGYFQKDGYYWSSSGITSYLDGEHYYLKARQDSGLGAGNGLFSATVWEYDPYCLLPVHEMEYVTPEIVNHTRMEANYLWSDYAKTMDWNGNETVMEHDSLGNVIKISGREGDGGGKLCFTVRRVYDFLAYQKRKEPLSIRELARDEKEKSSREVIRYFDGGGELAEEISVDESDGAQGRYVVKNKKLRFEGREYAVFYPYYSGSEKFSGFTRGETKGLMPMLTRYDAKGRKISREVPKSLRPAAESAAGLLMKMEYGPWGRKYYRVFDILKESAYAKAVRELSGDSRKERAAKEALEKALGYGTHPIRYENDILGNICLEVVEEESMLAASYAFDEYGRPVLAADPRLHDNGLYNLKATYDFQGNLLKTESVDTGIRWRAYDIFRRAFLEADGNGNEKRFLYDGLNRMIKKYQKGIGLAEQVLYGECEEGRKIPQSSGQITRHYDQAGLEIREAFDRYGNVLKQTRYFLKDWKNSADWEDNPLLEESGFTEEASFNAFGEETLYIAPDGLQGLTEWDGRGRRKRVLLRRGEREIPVITKMAYDADGKKSSLTYGNGTMVQYSFDTQSRELCEIRAARENGEILQKLTYCYDAAGHLSRLFKQVSPDIMPGAEEVEYAYGYDRYGRLVSAEGREPSGTEGADGSILLSPYTEKYRYDFSNNLLEVKHEGKAFSHTDKRQAGAGGNRLLKMGRTTLAYDHNGNQLILPEGGEAVFNGENQLVGTRFAGKGESEYYCYDYGGRRLRKVCLREETGEIEETRYLGRYVYETGRKKTGELEEIQEEKSSYLISSEGGLCAIFGQDLRKKETEVQYFLNNHTDSVEMELDEAAEILSYEEYTAFGKTAFLIGNEKAASEKKYHFGSKERDGSGLSYFETRYYDSFRFISGDTLAYVRFGDWMSLNLYTYCRNNPHKYTDYTGEDPGDIFATMDLAAQDFASYINPTSIRRDVEYGAFLYSAGGRYFYSTEFTDNSPDSVDFNYGRPPAGAALAALLHTHSAHIFGGLSEFFSHQDKVASQDFSTHVGYNVPIYVATPKGKVKKYDPSKRIGTRVTTVSSNAPHDHRAMWCWHPFATCLLCI